VGKRSGAANISYGIFRRAAANGGIARFFISSTGAAGGVVNADSASEPAFGEWHFFAGRFTPSTEVKLYWNENTFTNVAAIPATIYDGTASFTVGASATPANYMDGRASMCWLCACALSDALVNHVYQQSRAMFNRV